MNRVMQQAKHKFSQFCLLIVFFSLGACNEEPAYILGPQLYKDVEVIVDVRPGAPRVGMNEFIIVATHKNGLPGHLFIVSIKLEGTQEWHQSIQDGHSGVYRRALRVNDPKKDVLLVQLQQENEEGILSFPLAK